MLQLSLAKEGNLALVGCSRQTKGIPVPERREDARHITRCCDLLRFLLHSDGQLRQLRFVLWVQIRHRGPQPSIRRDIPTTSIARFNRCDGQLFPRTGTLKEGGGGNSSEA